MMLAMDSMDKNKAQNLFQTGTTSPESQAEDLQKPSEPHFPVLFLWAYLTALIFLIVISSQESILDPLESDLGTHMILEHALYFTIGALSIIVAERFLKIATVNQRNSNERLDTVAMLESILIRRWTQVLRKIFFLNKYGLVWIAIAAFLLALWHLPLLFNLASESKDVHILQHFSFIIVGQQAS